MDGPERPKHYFDLREVERTAWDMLSRGALSRKSAFHQATVASVTADGLPAARTVVLRKADRDAWTLRFHTDTRSRKFTELSQSQACEMLFYDHGAKIQVRARGNARLHHQDETTEAIWGSMRDMSKACYRQPVGPGEVLAAPDGAEGDLLSDAGGYSHFVVVMLAVREIEWLYLAAKGHRRALIERDAGRWLAP